MVKLSKVNLFLHQFPSPAIHIYDSLSNDARWPEKADLIFANPPFMTPKGGVTPHTKFRIPAKKAEVLFTDYIAEHLTPDGRAGIIVPNGIVATTQNAYVKLRRFLVEDSLVGVVSLPAGVFKPYSGVKTSILLLDKKLARKTDKILFLKITADGFDLGDQRREIEADDLPEAERVMKAWFKGKITDDFVSPLTWKVVEKRELLAHRSCSLQTEALLGEVIEQMGDHELVRLGDICDDFMNGVNFAKEQVGRGVKFVNIKDVFSNGAVNCDALERVAIEPTQIAKRLARPGDILFVRSSVKRSGVGYASVMPEHHEPVVFCGFIIKCTPRATSVFPKYLFYQLRSQRVRNRIVELSSTSAITNVSQDNLKLVEIPLPPLEEQRRIVAEIEGYQQVIDGARQILAAYRPGFDANPEWALVSLGEFAQVGGTIRKEIDPTLPYIGSDSIEASTGKLLQKKSCAEQGIEGPVYEFEGLRLLYSKIRPYLNKLTLTDFHGYCSSDVYPLVIDETKALRRFVAYHLLSPSFLDAISGFHERVSIPKINREQLFSVQIPLPPLPEQERIVAELDAEAARLEAVRGLLPAFEAKIQRTLARVWGTET